MTMKQITIDSEEKDYYRGHRIKSYLFYGDKHIAYKCAKYKSCEKCDFLWLDDDYIEIIKSLKKAGLLSSDYLLVCCECFNKQNKN